MYNFLFGPVPSRRLGRSLGIDIVPLKLCTLDCVYCEVGMTTELTLERKEYVRFTEVTGELTDFLENNPDPDYFTFSGSGEPTLNLRIGDIIGFIKKIRPDIPVAVLTNGTLLYDREVRRSLKDADVVLPSLDAATLDVFNRINRPVPALQFEQYIKGLITFSREFPGKIWLEVFILPGYNDSEEELAALKETILKIAPDSVQLNSLDRPGTLKDLKCSTREELKRIADAWDLPNVQIIASASGGVKTPCCRPDFEEAILETIARRPCTLEDLGKGLGINTDEIRKVIEQLESRHLIESVFQDRGNFYRMLKPD